jgi:hypothetical protein
MTDVHPVVGEVSRSRLGETGGGRLEHDAQATH